MSDRSAGDRRELRRDSRAVRRAFVSALAPGMRQALELALARQVLPDLGPPGILGSHAAVGDEIDPAALDHLASAAGWTLAYPRVTEGGRLVFHRCLLADLRPGFRGIPEPPGGAPIVRPDVILVPLLAVDAAGNRLGQGGGHYDRTLAVLRAGGSIRAVGLGWDVQRVEMLAPEPWDAPLDALATPTSFRLTGARTMPPA
jgi:5-formyltetrahydrofolate cyclo-ligase